MIEKRSIVLADFSNSTGDPIFEDTLRQGLASQLEQSPFFDIVSEERIAQTLGLMGQPRDTRLTPAIASEICRRNGDSAWVDGSIANLEGEYVLGLRAMNCQNSQTLAQAQVTAKNKKEVLRALGGAATQLRAKLGESFASMQKFDTPLDQATTPSLEALQAYSLGRKAMWKTEDANAVLLYRRAIQLDPGFALAYSALGMAYVNLGQTVLAAENSKKAYELRAQVSDREKFYIESHYLQNVSGNLEKARDVYELWAQTYPNDLVPRDNLGGIYFELGLCDRSLANDLEGFRVDPENASGYADRAEDYICLNRLEDAQTTVEQALGKNLDNPRLRTTTYVLAFLRNDEATMAEQVRWGAGKAGVEEVLLALEAETAAWKGDLGKARTFSRQAASLALSEGQSETAALYEVFSALRESQFGDPAATRRHVEAALKLSRGRDVQAVAALALAFAGETARSENLARSVDKNFPEDTVVQSNYLPTINAQLELNGKNFQKAVLDLQATAPYEFGNLDGAITTALYPIYVRGQAYLAAHDGQQAAREFQKILDRSGVAQNRLIGTLSQLGLARAYRLQGDAAKARTTYGDFLRLWKDADPDLPILKQAKSEYGKLN